LNAPAQFPPNDPAIVAWKPLVPYSETNASLELAQSTFSRWSQAGDEIDAGQDVGRTEKVVSIDSQKIGSNVSENRYRSDETGTRDAKITTATQSGIANSDQWSKKSNKGSMKRGSEAAIVTPESKSHGHHHGAGALPTPESIANGNDLDWVGDPTQRYIPPPKELVNERQGGTQRPNNLSSSREALDRNSNWPRKKDFEWDEQKAYSDWGEPEKDIDYNAISHLVDWDGNWLPAPVEWEGRRAFQSQDFYKNISDWIEFSENEQGTFVPNEDLQRFLDGEQRHVNPQKSSVEVNHKMFLGIEKGNGQGPRQNSEIAPRTWIPKQIDGVDLEPWWNFIQAEEPRTLDPEDGDRQREPFWRTYWEDLYPYQKPLKVPTPRMDATDEDYQLGKDAPTADRAAKQYIERLERKERNIRAAKRNIKTSQRSPPAVFNPPPPQPKTNVYLRYATPQDIDQIVEIYNWDVKNTWNVPELSPRTPGDLRERLRDITTASLPFIVAVGKANKHRKGQIGPLSNEAILGMAYADDYHDEKGMWRFAVELEIYVHHEKQGSGIGSALMDRMLALLSQHHTAMMAADWRPQTMQNNGQRIIGNILAHVPYESEDKARKAIISAWLKKYGFNLVGHLDDTGIKKMKRYGSRHRHRNVSGDDNFLQHQLDDLQEEDRFLHRPHLGL
jgi:L-amino acid N-acyltransferase YncA